MTAGRRSLERARFPVVNGHTHFGRRFGAQDARRDAGVAVVDRNRIVGHESFDGGRGRGRHQSHRAVSRRAAGVPVSRATVFPLRQTWAFAVGTFLVDPIWWRPLFRMSEPAVSVRSAW